MSDGDCQAESEISEYEVEKKTVKKYKCTVEDCDAAFVRPSRLERHMNTHENKRPYKCSHKGCDKSYTNSSHLKRHIQTHSLTTETYECSVCLVKISTLSNLKRHYKRAHCNEDKLFCKECNLRFRKKNRYEEHKATHDNRLMYKCNRCEKQFLTHMKLAKHELVHKNKNYKCSLQNCSQVFENWLMLQEHKKIEHANVVYSCTKCDKVFKTKVNYNSHAKVHSENRPAIPCPYENCTHLFYYKRNLNTHIKTKHIGDKFECDICDLKLASKQKIKEHIINMHLSKKKHIIRKAPQQRKDAGIAKKSLLSELTGIKLDIEVEKQLMRRNPAALLRDEAIEDPSSFSEDDRTSDFSAKGA